MPLHNLLRRLDEAHLMPLCSLSLKTNRLFSASDVEVPFTGILARYLTTDLAEDVFTTLAPSESSESIINIAALHAVRGGDYKIFSAGAIPFAAANSTALVGSIAFESNTLQMSLDSDEVIQTANLIPTLDKRTILTSCSGSQDTALRNALTNARSLATTAANAAASGSATKFAEYFKSTSTSVRSTVAARLRAVAAEAGSTTSGSTQHYCGDPYGYCSPNVLAYTIPSQNVVANVSLSTSSFPKYGAFGYGHAVKLKHKHVSGLSCPGTGTSSIIRPT
jgi:deuterolysin